MTKSEQVEKMAKDTVAFFKDALCVDGDAEIMPEVKAFEMVAVLKFTDSKRGIFYLAMVKESEISEDA
jgi:hypothetical protein